MIDGYEKRLYQRRTAGGQVYGRRNEYTPSARHMRVGDPSIRPEDEWNGGKFGLNFGERYSFIHKPIQMKRNDENVLVGREVVS